MKRSDIGVSLLIAALAVGSVSWNLERFIGAKMTIRMDPHLEFLPNPQVARTLTLGHHNTMAKLRWIDSFGYFSYQLEHTDDSGGFTRLYETLIALDPNFRPFYEHAVTCVGAIMNDRHNELRFAVMGVDNLPLSTPMWASLMATLTVHYRLEERHPEQMEDLLELWGQMELSKPEGNPALPGDWMAALARRHTRGLGQLTYWGRTLLVSDPDAPNSRVARVNMTEQLSRYGITQLQALVDAHKERTGMAPLELFIVLQEANLRGVYASPSDVVDPAEPITIVGDRIVLRRDPFGGEYALDEDGQVISRGLNRHLYLRRLAGLNAMIRQRAVELGRWPNSVAEARTWSAWQLPPMPDSGTSKLVDGLIVVSFATDLTPWSDAELLAAAGLDGSAAEPAHQGAE